jgi:rod shape determining protein RodA
MRLALPTYVMGLALLVGVALFGEVRNGARRWLSLGFTTIQPSEVMKIGVPLVLAWYFHRHEEGLRVRDFVIAAILLAIPVGLIVRQPDLGTALLIFASGFFVIFLAGLSWKVLIALVAAGGASLPFLWSVLHDYQRRRILTLLDPMEDPLGAGYHIIQATIAIGSGESSARGGSTAPRRSSISSPSARRTSSSPSSARSSVSPATSCSWCCTSSSSAAG